MTCFSVMIEINWVFVSGHQNRLDIEWDRSWLDFSDGIAINLVWNWLGFSVGIELDFFFVRGSKSTSILCVGRNYLVLIYGSKLNWFLCASRRWLVFSVRIDWLSFCAGGRNLLDFCMLADNHLVLVWASNLTSFCVGGRNWLDFILGDQTWLDFIAGIGIGLVLLWGSKTTWF